MTTETRTPAVHALNAAQQAAVSAGLDRPLQVIAGAGTGKTEVIARRYVRLFEHLHQRGFTDPAAHLLVVTFTEAAACEMVTRIAATMQTTLSGTPLQDSFQPGRDPAEPLGGHWVGTFHQLATRLLRAQNNQRRQPDFRVLDSLQQRLLFRRLVERLCAGELAGESVAVFDRFGLNDLDPHLLSAARLRVVPGVDVRAMVSADWLYAIIQQIKSAGLSPSAFRQTALRQSADWTTHLLALPAFAETHSDPAEVMQAHIAAWRQHLTAWSDAGWDPLSEAVASAERKAGKREGLSATEWAEPVKPLATAMLRGEGRGKKRVLIPQAPDELLWRRQLAGEQGVTDMLAAVYAHYQATLHQQNACDFDDLINGALDTLLSEPAVEQQWRGRFEGIIVDEFQDSSHSQLMLLQRLMRPGAANLTVVGDLKQSIYGFRFAQPENMQRIVQGADPLTVSLQTNYRTHGDILSGVNRLTAELTGNDDRQTLQSGRDFEALPLPPVTWVSLAGEAPMAEQQTSEARCLAHAAQEASRFYPWRAMAILATSHQKLGTIQRHLSAAGIPAVRAKHVGFFAEPVVQQALALLTLIDRPGDRLAWTTVLQPVLDQATLRQWLTPLADEEGETAGRDARLGQRLLALCSAHPALAGLSERLTSALNAKQQVRERPAPHGLVQPLLAWLKERCPAALDEDAQKRVDALLTMADGLILSVQESLREGRHTPVSIPEVLALIAEYQADASLELPVDNPLRDENAVQLMTIHAAKGLEFPVVMVAATEKVFVRPDTGVATFDPQDPGRPGFGMMIHKPDQIASLKHQVYRMIWKKPRALAEARRLFYVAITRAQKHLVVIRSGASAPWTDAALYAPLPSWRLIDESHDPAAFRQEWLTDQSSSSSSSSASSSLV
ncbi:MAG: ATP-dependent helicase [Candidatus Melainabacteria bacterium]